MWLWCRNLHVRTPRTIAEDVLAVQELRPAMVHRPKSTDPVSGTGVVPKRFMHRVVYLTTDAMPSVQRRPMTSRSVSTAQQALSFSCSLPFGVSVLLLLQDRARGRPVDQ